MLIHLQKNYPSTKKHIFNVSAFKARISDYCKAHSPEKQKHVIGSTLFIKVNVL